MRPSFFHHLHPPTIPARQARWSYTLGAGGLAVFLTIVVGATGVLETFYYIPTPDQAAQSVQTIAYLVPFGGLVRSLHYWSAQMLAAFAGLHLLRVFFTGAYAGRRRFNHLLGMALMVGIVLVDFTGYVLRWDQGIQWALVVGTNLLGTIPLVGDALLVMAAGGPELTAPALIRFYAWHIFGLTLPFIVFAIWHVFRVRRDGGIAVPPPALRTDHERIPRQALVRTEVMAALITGAILLLLSAIWPAPIAPPITDIQGFSGEASAPWFFLWVQEMLKWGDPFLFGVAVPLILLGVLAGLPYLAGNPAPAELGTWFPHSGRGIQIIVALMTAAVVVLTVAAVVGTS